MRVLTQTPSISIFPVSCSRAPSLIEPELGGEKGQRRGSVCLKLRMNVIYLLHVLDAPFLEVKGKGGQPAAHRAEWWREPE
jgi:hypothetical protein